MTMLKELVCDGCGQAASPEHIAKRLQRLEWATRYRPVHIQTLLLSGISPLTDAEFLYSPAGEFLGEAQRFLKAAGISFDGKTREAVHVEFQRGGFFLTHVLECPLEKASEGNEEAGVLLQKRLPAVIARIRRSLKPKQVVLIGKQLESLLDQITAADLGCPILLDEKCAFVMDDSDSSPAFLRLQKALGVSMPSLR